MSPTNPIIEQMHAHASVRRYKTDPVPREWIEAIVQAGQRAATSSNLQMYSVVAVTEPQTRVALVPLCGGQGHIAEAPVFLAWCADLSVLGHACALRGHAHEHGYVENFLLAAVDASLAMQNAALAAESLGLGTCYIGAIRNRPRDVIQLLGLPKLVFPISGMTVGWAAHPHRTRPRLPMTAVLHWEHHSTDDLDQALAEYDRAMIATGIYEGRHVPVPGRPGEVEEYGWTEHSARRVSQPARPGLRDVLAEQGFELK